jgi:hypothetical protein
LTKPKFITLTPRPWKSFSDYVSKIPKWKKHTFYCLECDGSGRVHRWEDRDPYEGFKMAPTYVCGSCGGKGYVPESKHREFYNQKIASWRKERAVDSERLKNQKALWAKIKNFPREELKELWVMF